VKIQTVLRHVDALLGIFRGFNPGFEIFLNCVKEPNPQARAAGRALIAQAKEAGAKRKTFIYVNNRLEGNALETISAMVEQVG